MKMSSIGVLGGFEAGKPAYGISPIIPHFLFWRNTFNGHGRRQPGMLHVSVKRLHQHMRFVASACMTMAARIKMSPVTST